LAWLALTHAALILTTNSFLALGVVITVAGAAIAPTVSTIYALVEAAASAGTQTESFSWLLTAASVGRRSAPAVRACARRAAPPRQHSDSPPQPQASRFSSRYLGRAPSRPPPERAGRAAACCTSVCPRC
jgi:hypothetical protein